MIISSKEIILEEWEKQFIIDSLRKEARNEEDFDLLDLFDTPDIIKITSLRNTINAQKSNKQQSPKVNT